MDQDLNCGYLAQLGQVHKFNFTPSQHLVAHVGSSIVDQQ
jgi:hypothetical protein